MFISCVIFFPDEKYKMRPSLRHSYHQMREGIHSTCVIFLQTGYRILEYVTVTKECASWLGQFDADIKAESVNYKNVKFLNEPNQTNL